MEYTFLNMAMAAYLFAALMYVIHLASKRAGLATIGLALVALGTALAGAGIGSRWVTSGRPPLTNTYETVVFFAFCLGLLLIVEELVYRMRAPGAPAALLAALSLAGSSLLETKAEPLMPALQSNWLTIHVVFCFVGYAAFAMAFLASLLFLFRQPGEEVGKKLYALIHEMIKFGFFFLTLGILTGSVWANEAWAGYWTWDPKETWALITWCIYAIYLHFPLVAPKLGISRARVPRMAAAFSAIGFAAVVFTYFGVNYLLAGLHSYS